MNIEIERESEITIEQKIENWRQLFISNINLKSTKDIFEAMFSSESTWKLFGELLKINENDLMKVKSLVEKIKSASFITDDVEKFFERLQIVEGDSNEYNLDNFVKNFLGEPMPFSILNTSDTNTIWSPIVFQYTIPNVVDSKEVPVDVVNLDKYIVEINILAYSIFPALYSIANWINLKKKIDNKQLTDNMRQYMRMQFEGKGVPCSFGLSGSFPLGQGSGLLELTTEKKDVIKGDEHIRMTRLEMLDANGFNFMLEGIMSLFFRIELPDGSFLVPLSETNTFPVFPPNSKMVSWIMEKFLNFLNKGIRREETNYRIKTDHTNIINSGPNLDTANLYRSATIINACIKKYLEVDGKMKNLGLPDKGES